MTISSNIQTLFKKDKNLFLINLIAFIGALSPTLSLVFLSGLNLLEEDFESKQTTLFNRVFNFWLCILSLKTVLFLVVFFILKIELYFLVSGYSLTLLKVSSLISFILLVFAGLNFLLFFKEKPSIYPELKFLKIDFYSHLKNLFNQFSQQKH